MTGPEATTPPWDHDVVGVELLIIQPVIKRVLFLERRPDVRWPAPIEGVVRHVSLRLVEDRPAAEQWTAGVSAYMDTDGDGEDDPSNVWRGLTGGYDLEFLLETLPDLADNYAFQHARWMARYAIPMSPDEVAVLLQVLQDASGRGDAHALGSYVFFTENCSTEITELLDVALLGKPRELNYPYTLPRKYQRRGAITPLIDKVTPAEAASGAFEVNWAIPASIVRRCADGDVACAQTWVADATAAFGEDWVVDMARLARRHTYERRWSPELRAELERVRLAARD